MFTKLKRLWVMNDYFRGLIAVLMFTAWILEYRDIWYVLIALVIYAFIAWEIPSQRILRKHSNVTRLTYTRDKKCYVYVGPKDGVIKYFADNGIFHVKYGFLHYSGLVIVMYDNVNGEVLATALVDIFGKEHLQDYPIEMVAITMSGTITKPGYVYDRLLLKE